MSKYPALPLWTDALTGDTYHLSAAEFGCYMRLLVAAWRRPSCSLPDNDTLLARLVGETEAEWMQVKGVVMAFWKYDEKRREWTQKRLTKERKYVKRKSRLQKERIAKRWNKKKKEDTTVLPDGYRRDTPTPIPTPTPIKQRKKETPNGVSKERRAPAERGSHLPPDWQPTEDQIYSLKTGKGKFADEEIRRELAKFIDYWCAEAGQRARKRDWFRTFRNWLEKSREYRGGNGAASAGQRREQHSSSESLLGAALQFERDARDSGVD